MELGAQWDRVRVRAESCAQARPSDLAPTAAARPLGRPSAPSSANIHDDVL